MREHAQTHGVALATGHAALAAEAELVVSAVTASQAVPVAAGLRAGDAPRHLLPRLQLGLAGRQDPRRGAGRWRRRTLCRRRGDDVDPAVPHQGAAAARRPERGGARSRAGRARLRAARGERKARRRLGHQDVPQRDDQGPRGDGDRELHDGTRLWRRRRGAGVAARDLPRHRLGKTGRVLLPARHRARPAPQRRGARGRRDRARDRPRRRGRRPAPPSARPGSPISPMPACSAPAARPASHAAPTGASRPTASSPRAVAIAIAGDARAGSNDARHDAAHTGAKKDMA